MRSGLHFLSFADGGFDWRQAGLRIAREARAMRAFDSVECYDLARLGAELAGAGSACGRLAASHARGAGLYVWKPHAIAARLARLADGEALLYADAGCELNGNRRGEPAALAAEIFDIAAYQLNTADGRGWPSYAIGAWTNGHVLRALGCEAAWLDEPQFAGGAMFVRKTPAAVALIEEWTALCAHDGGALLLDRPGEPERPGFVAHRHDQSIVSILLRRSAAAGRLRLRALDGRFLEAAGEHFLYAARNKTGLSRALRPRDPRALAYRLRRKLAGAARWADLRAQPPGRPA